MGCRSSADTSMTKGLGWVCAYGENAPPLPPENTPQGYYTSDSLVYHGLQRRPSQWLHSGPRSVDSRPLDSVDNYTRPHLRLACGSRTLSAQGATRAHQAPSGRDSRHGLQRGLYQRLRSRRIWANSWPLDSLDNYSGQLHLPSDSAPTFDGQLHHAST
jgi:hypothetical protein